MKKHGFITAFLLLAVLESQAQTSSLPAPTDSVKVIEPPAVRSSPMAMAFYKKEDLYLKVVYSQPMRRGRPIFGSLVPFGKVWRTGANEATELTTTKDLRLNGKTLKAGTYTLFTIPDRNKWTVVINAELGQWGEYKYDESRNLLVFEVPISHTPTEIYEAFTMRFAETSTGVDLTLHWDDTKITIPISTGTTATVNTLKKKK